MRYALAMIAVLACTPATAQRVKDPEAMAIVAVSYGLAAQKHCPAQGFVIDGDAWNELYRRLGVEQRMADYAPGGRLERFTKLALGAKGETFQEYPMGGCLNTVDWASHFFPDLAPRLIKPPKAF